MVAATMSSARVGHSQRRVVVYETPVPGMPRVSRVPRGPMVKRAPRVPMEMLGPLFENTGENLDSFIEAPAHLDLRLRGRPILLQPAGTPIAAAHRQTGGAMRLGTEMELAATAGGCSSWCRRWRRHLPKPNCAAFRSGAGRGRPCAESQAAIPHLVDGARQLPQRAGILDPVDHTPMYPGFGVGTQHILTVASPQGVTPLQARILREGEGYFGVAGVRQMTVMARYIGATDHHHGQVYQSPRDAYRCD